MLIGIDANEANLTSNRVGINEYAFNLLWALYKSPDLPSRHKFVIYLKSAPLSDLPSTSLVWSYRIIPFPALWTQTRLPLDLYTHRPRPDVFFSMTHYAPRYSPIPSVISIMDLGFLQMPEQFTKKDFNQLKSWTEYSAKQATKIIAISHNTKEAIIKNYNRNPSDVGVTYLGYNHQLFTPTRNPSVLNKYGIKQPYVLFLSSLKPSKNIEGLIKAFAKLNIKNYSLVISGKKAWLYKDIFKLVQKLSLQNKVIFTGFIEEKEKPILISMSQVFVLPSFHEGFGIPVLEAMACATPVVVSNVASLPEVAGEAGIYVDPYSIESIAKGIKTAIDKRSKFVKAGLDRVKSFNWGKTAQETLKILESAKL